MDEIVTLIPHHRVLLCQICSSGVAQDSIDTHFRDHQVKGEVLANIKAYYGADDLRDPTKYRPGAYQELLLL